MDVVVLALRVLLSLGVVLALLFVLHRKVSRINGNRAGAGLVSVVARQGIGAKASVVVLDAEGTRFYLGVTEQSVSVLHSSAAPRALQAVPGSDDAAGRTAPAVAGPAETSDARFAASLKLAGGAVDTLPAADVAPAPATASPTSRRAARATESARPGAPLNGSILSPATWKQTAAFLRQGRAG
ncbi:FliO/MopB family protein [Arthrobacter agilis]|uniref:FliO/MopB family protein n=1 Tax=Arthrobacter agilis TaxID=37921 RepID=UPI002786BAB0|nr:flagellar biosynthetic protein FliO [Arthrobacter agilis]MDQ0737107.1 flagellar protein FliO/FliZ [Arthrobacter agilis]